MEEMEPRLLFSADPAAALVEALPAHDPVIAPAAPVQLDQCRRMADLEELMQLDPFVREGAARFEVIGFRTSQYADAFAAFADP